MSLSALQYATKWLVFGVIVVLLAATKVQSYELLWSNDSSRVPSQPLQGSSIAGDVYIHVQPETDVDQVKFYLDGILVQTERNSPYDFAGTDSQRTDHPALPWNSAEVGDGTHQIAVDVFLVGGENIYLTDTFEVTNDSQGQHSLTFNLLPDQQASDTVEFTVPDEEVTFTITEDASWLEVTTTSFTTPATLTFVADSSGMSAPTSLQATVAITAPDMSPFLVDVFLSVVQSQADQIHVSYTDDPSTSFTVIWRSLDPQTPSEVEYREAGHAEFAAASGQVRLSGVEGMLHEVVISGLQPATTYEYRVRRDREAFAAIHLTRTAPAPGPADFSVAFLADTGLIGREDGLATGTAQVRDEIMLLDPLLVLLGGDYAYFNTDTRFATQNAAMDEWFQQMEQIGRRSALMPTYGNHEVLLQEKVSLWQQRFAVPSGGVNDDLNYSFTVGDVHFISILAPWETSGIPQNAVDWLINDIGAARAAGARWIIPFFHVPPFSDGKNHKSNLSLRAQLGPLFENLGVPLVLTAHDQSYERTYPLMDIGGSDTPTTTALDCYELGSQGPIFVKISPGGKLSNISGDFSPFRTDPPPHWSAVRNNEFHNYGELMVSSAGNIRVNVYGVLGNGEPPVTIDSFQIVDGTCPATLSADPGTIQMSMGSGESATASIDIAATDGSAWIVNAGIDVDWAVVQPDSFITPETLVITIDSTGLQPGSYTGNLELISTAGTNATRSLPIVLQVTSPLSIQVSLMADRLNPAPLDGKTVTGIVYPFTPETPQIDYVQFFLDGQLIQKENRAPYDAAGTGSSLDIANPFDTENLSDGQHVLEAKVVYLDGTSQTAKAVFYVLNSGPSLFVSPAMLELTALEGESLLALVSADASSGSPELTVSTNQAWLSAEVDGPIPTTVRLGTSPLPVGSYSGSVTLTADGYQSATISVSLDVLAEPPPPTLTFNSSHLAFNMEEGAAAQSQNLVLGTSSTNPADYAITTSAAWLRVNPENGVTPATLMVTADPAGLPPGVYPATVTAQADGFDAAVLDVTMVINGEIMLFYSDKASRANPADLNGATVSGTIYPFSSEDPHIDYVLFYLDGQLLRRETNPPYDVAGGNVSTANPFNTGNYGNGQHVIGTEVHYLDSSIQTYSTSFFISN